MDLAAATKKIEATFVPGDRVTITKMGNHTDELAIVLKEQTIEGGRIRVTCPADGKTRSYYAHELKKQASTGKANRPAGVDSSQPGAVGRLPTALAAHFGQTLLIAK